MAYLSDDELLDTEEEEAAPVSDKRFKPEMRAEAIRRLEEAARTEKDFRAVVEEWNKLDRNRERQFLEEYSKIAGKQGKDAVIRRENKTKRRKKKNRP